MPELFTLYKLIVLYMLEKVDFSMTNAQISEFILDRGYTDYFTLQSVIGELLDSGMLRQEMIQNCSYYSLTDAGEEALHFFSNRISAPIKEDIEQYLTQNKMKLMDEVSVIADYYKNTANEYSVRCLVKEKYSNPIDLTITVPDETQAKLVCRKWKQKCQDIYGYIMKELL